MHRDVALLEASRVFSTRELAEPRPSALHHSREPRSLSRCCRGGRSQRAARSHGPPGAVVRGLVPPPLPRSMVSPARNVSARN